MPRRLLLIYTGGTIGMKQQAEGLVPANDLAADILDMPELGQAFHARPPIIDIITYDELIDSSDMTPAQWIRIARDVEQHYDDYDGFVILHGTDTLAYTSSALSFFLRRSGKPVVLTGAQLPFGFPRSDARNNLISALEVAANMPPELARVCVVFGSRILQGNRATKVSAQAYDAFDSPRFLRLGSIGIDIEYNSQLPAINQAFRGEVRNGHAPPNDSVALIKLFPGFSPVLLEAICAGENLRGIVLEAFGSGNGPSQDKHFLATVSAAVEKGIAVVVVSQPLDGVVQMRSYAAGSALARAGATSGRDLTTEAALTKLYYLVARNEDMQSIQQAMQESLAGEVTPRND